MNEIEALKLLKKANRDNYMVGILPKSDIGKCLIKALEEVQQYRKIGTVDECIKNKDFLDFLSDKMNPNDFETYLRLYNALEEKGCEE